MPNTFTEPHLCVLSEAELEEYRKIVVDLDGKIIEAEAARKDEVDKHSAIIKALKKEHRAKLEAVQSGEEKRDVEVTEETDMRLGKVIHRRLDTGAVVFERPLDSSERQESLFDDDEPEGVLDDGDEEYTDHFGVK